MEHRGFYGSKNTLYDVTLMDMSLYIYLTPKICNTKSEHMANYGLWVIMMSQYRFILGNNVPLWWGMLLIGYVCVGAWGMWEISIFLSVLL